MRIVHINGADLIQIIKDRFGMDIEAASVVLDHADVSRTAQATVLLTNKKQLLVYIEGSSPLLLADIKKIIAHMGLKAELYLPPRGWPAYFDDIGSQKFRQVFPGMKITSKDDLVYYRTLAPYNPALVLISEVKNGEIYQFDADAHGSWQVGARLSYRRVPAE